MAQYLASVSCGFNIDKLTEMETLLTQQSKYYDIVEEADKYADAVENNKYMWRAYHQNKSSPDLVLTRETDVCDWMVVSDGHGEVSTPGAIEHNTVLRSLSWTSIMEKASPIDEVNRLVAEWYADNGLEEGIETGSTISMARIYETGVECINVGDAQTVVIIDGKLAYMSTPHVFNNPDECQRLWEEGNASHTVIGSKIHMVSPYEIIPIPKHEVVFHTGGLQLGVTMALGHQNITGCAPSVEHIEFQPGQEVMVMVFNHAFGDMFLAEDPDEITHVRNLSPDELIDMVNERWNQSWLYQTSDSDFDVEPTTVKIVQQSNVNVAVWRNYFQ